MGIDEAIKIAKQLNPDIGPSLDIDRKNLAEKELAAKLLKFFADNRKAIEIMKVHPGKSAAEIKALLDRNVSAHVVVSNHVGLFVYNVLNRKGDLAALADSAGKRIILSDPRIEAALAKLKPEEKAERAEKIFNIVVIELSSYFENLKEKKLDQNQIIEELTTKVTAKIGETLKTI